MLQLSIREFNKNISKSFKTLPVEITLRGYVVARIIPPGWFWKEIAEKAGAKYKADAMVNTTKINVVKLKMDELAKEKLAKNLVATPKIPSERSSVEKPPPVSASPPPNMIPIPPPPSGYPLPKDANEILNIPKLRKKLCPKHSVFSCGCKEKYFRINAFDKNFCFTIFSGIGK